MDVNAKGTFLVIQALLPQMKAQSYGRICHIASIGGKHGAPNRSPNKRITPLPRRRSWASPAASAPVTDMGRVNLDDPAVREVWRGKTAMARIGDPEDVVGPVVFLFRRQRLCNRTIALRAWRNRPKLRSPRKF
jgi:NAD(P)-dependent dehydrogenase (short-subunit alcohol dehydrogenase family)